MKQSLLLQGKVAVVTGCSRGIGRSIVTAFVSAGARVACCSSSLEKSTAADSSLAKSNILPVKADVGEEADVIEMKETIASLWGHVDILVNSAALLGKMVRLRDYSVPEWDRVMRVNLRGPFLMVKHMLPLMSSGASIINVSSGFGLRGRANSGAYGISKFGIEGFSQILAEELFPLGIRVNVVDPGAVRTAMRASVCPDEDPTTVPHPDEIMPLFVFLASDASSGITGQRFNAQRFLGGTNVEH